MMEDNTTLVLFDVGDWLDAYRNEALFVADKLVDLISRRATNIEQEAAKFAAFNKLSGTSELNAADIAKDFIVSFDNLSQKQQPYLVDEDVHAVVTDYEELERRLLIEIF